MASLYGRLFAYRERPDRKPLEDFLTEALCDILNRLPVAEMVEVTGELFLPAAAQEAWRQETKNAESLRWTSQEWIESGTLRVDLLLRSDDGQPLLIIENKIGSGIGQHQLPGYGFWLGKKCKNQTWPGALALLTHFTAPPDGFGSSDCAAYGVPYQRICRWPQVWKWLDARGSQSNTDAIPTACQVLAAELAQFLQEKGMASETMTLHDLAAAEMYVASADRTSHLFQQIWDKAIAPDWKRNAYGHDPSQIERSLIQYESEGGVLWDWFYLRPPFSPHNWNVWYVAWGIVFPQIGDWWEDAVPSLPSRIYAFLCLCSQEERRSLPKLLENVLCMLGKEWSVSASDGNCLIKARAICEFDPDPDRLAEHVIAWITKGAEQLKSVLPEIVNAAQPSNDR